MHKLQEQTELSKSLSTQWPHQLSKVRTSSQMIKAMFSRSLYVGSRTEYLC